MKCLHLDGLLVCFPLVVLGQSTFAGLFYRRRPRLNLIRLWSLAESSPRGSWVLREWPIERSWIERCIKYQCISACETLLLVQISYTPELNVVATAESLLVHV